MGEKTKIVLSQDKDDAGIRRVSNYPYVVIGSTCLPQSFGVFLQGDTLKEIIKKMRKGEDLRLTFTTGEYPEIEIIDTHSKYGKRKNR